jgi:hypothetical protein
MENHKNSNFYLIIAHAKKRVNIIEKIGIFVVFGFLL